MDTKHLGQDEFFERLCQIFDLKNQVGYGAVYLTQKRLTNSAGKAAGRDAGTGELLPVEPLPVIIRATNGKSKRDRASKVKLSTVVQPRDIESFYVRYAELCKANMTALKPRDRSKKKAKAKKKKTAS